jgi:hypothetical protein
MGGIVFHDGLQFFQTCAFAMVVSVLCPPVSPTS